MPGLGGLGSIACSASRVSAAEWLATSDRRFDALDDQQTGVLTREALQAMLPRPPKPGKRR